MVELQNGCFVEANDEKHFQNRQEDAQMDIFHYVSLGEEKGLSSEFDFRGQFEDLKEIIHKILRR